MRLNPGGFWRLLIVVFGLYAIGVAGVTTDAVWTSLRCPENSRQEWALDRRVSEGRARLEKEMMADLATADAAGDSELAQRIAGTIKAHRAHQPPAPNLPGYDDPGFVPDETGKVWLVTPRVIGNVWRVKVDGVSYELPSDATLGEIDAILSHPSDPWATPPTAQEIAAAKANPSSNLRWASRPRWSSAPVVSEGKDAGFDPDAYLRKKNAARPSRGLPTPLVIEVPEKGLVEFPAEMSNSEIIEVIAREVGACRPVAGRVGLGFAALIGGFVVLFGSALAVRWVYRGFVMSQS